VKAGWTGAALAAAPLLVLALLVGACGRPSGQSIPGLPRDVTGNPKRGETLFGEKGCIGCHTVNGIGGQVGPNLTEVSKRNLAKDRPGKGGMDLVAYIRESIRTPQAYIVPGFPNPSPMPSAEQFKLSDQDIDDIITFFFSLQRK
jgi:mono/diheme cytochrome c family protein